MSTMKAPVLAVGPQIQGQSHGLHYILNGLILTDIIISQEIKDSMQEWKK